MHISVDLQEAFSYFTGLIIVILLLILGITIYLIFNNKKKEQNETIEIKKVNKEDKNVIKKKYINMLEELSKKVNEKIIETRIAYQELSSIIRYFVYEMTGIKVQNYTLKEIKKLDMQNLYELIKEYYTPEFARMIIGNISASIDKTRKEIEKWN